MVTPIVFSAWLAAAAAAAAPEVQPSSAPGRGVAQALEACRQEQQAFCPGVALSTSAVRPLWDCLGGHVASLSEGCRKTYDGLTRGIDACAAERAELCPGVQSAGGALYACLKEHDGALSPRCRDYYKKGHGEVVERKGRMRKAQAPCARDLGALCPGHAPAGRAALKCLESHRAELSEACRAAVFP